MPPNNDFKLSSEQLAELHERLTPSEIFPFKDNYGYCHLRVPGKSFYDEIPDGLVPASKILVFSGSNPEVPLILDAEKLGDPDLSDEEIDDVILSTAGLYISESYVNPDDTSKLCKDSAIPKLCLKAARIGRPLGQLVQWASPIEALGGRATTATLSYDLRLGPIRLMHALGQVLANLTEKQPYTQIPPCKEACELDAVVRRVGFPKDSDLSPIEMSFGFSRQ